MVLLSWFMLFANAEQHVHPENRETSSTAVIIAGAIILLFVIVVLFKRQKRKFND